MSNGNKVDLIRKVINTIPDPEVPAISIVELGVLRSVEEKDGRVVISITPTYSGCPAIKVMEDSIREALEQMKIENFEIKTVLYPPWTTDWITTEAREKLRKYGIAPPEITTEEHLKLLFEGRGAHVTCPFCNSKETTLTSAFGSTACKALHFCNNCHQPFEEFKCH